MSATFSEIAAQALLEYCEARSASSKILISDLHGETPAALYAELALKADREVDVPLSETGPPYRMRAGPLPGGYGTLALAIDFVGRRPRNAEGRRYGHGGAPRLVVVDRIISIRPLRRVRTWVEFPICANTCGRQR